MKFIIILIKIYMIIIKEHVQVAFNKIDKKVLLMNLSDGAKVLYCYLVGLPVGKNFKDNYLLIALNISKQTLYNRKKELRDADLIDIDRLNKTTYIMFVGTSSTPASIVKRDWHAENERV